MRAHVVQVRLDVTFHGAVVLTTRMIEKAAKVSNEVLLSCLTPFLSCQGYCDDCYTKLFDFMCPSEFVRLAAFKLAYCVPAACGKDVNVSKEGFLKNGKPYHRACYTCPVCNTE